MRRGATLLVAAEILISLSSFGQPGQPVAGANTRPNIVILMTDDQRWDKVTPAYMPRVFDRLADTPANTRFPNATSTAFQNAFVPNPLCCPSRTSTLTGNYSHTTGVWSNGGPFGGFRSFDDRHTVAVDLDEAGYRTAMIGKYLNGYMAGRNTYVPQGWDRWFASDTSAYYDYGITSNGRLRRFGSDPKDYITRVISRRAITFVDKAKAAGDPFFLYYAFTAPHIPSIPDPRDLGRFAGATGRSKLDGMLESAYGADRAIGRLLNHLPANTIVVYLSDNGYLWGESKSDLGSLTGKQWPYNESIRVPLILASLDGTYDPEAQPNDIVLNVDLRSTLTRAAGLSPLTRTEGINWNGQRYAARNVFPLEHYSAAGKVPSYCGARELTWMYVRYVDGTEELYNDEAETTNLAGVPRYQADHDRLRAEAMAGCDPPPPGYAW